MAADPVPVRRLWRPAVLLAMPAVVVLATLAALHVLDAGYAFVAAVAVGVAAMVITRVALRDVALLRSYAETVAGSPEAHLPRLALPGTFQPVAVAIIAGLAVQLPLVLLVMPALFVLLRGGTGQGPRGAR